MSWTLLPLILIGIFFCVLFVIAAIVTKDHE